MVKIDLTDGELGLLRRAVERHLGGLREELAHADDRAYRASLRDELDRLETLDRRLQGAEGSGAEVSGR